MRCNHEPPLLLRECLRQQLRAGVHGGNGRGRDTSDLPQFDHRTDERIDLLFADVVMPGKVDGYELARIARERWPSLKIVLTSGFPAASREQDTAGFDGIRC